MKHFIWSLVRLVVGLAFFFNIERLDFGQMNVIDIHSAIYILGLVAVLAILSSSYLARLPLSRLVFIWFTIFLLLKLLLGNMRPLIGGIYTYLSLTEAFFLLLLVYLAYDAVGHLRDFQQAAEYLTMVTTGSKIPRVEESEERIRREMTRSRHYNRALSIIVVEPAEESKVQLLPRLVEEIQKQAAARLATVKLAELLKEELRVVDNIMEDGENGRFVVVCPEIDEEHVTLLLNRIQDVAAQRLGLTVSCGAASFPEEALTFEALTTKAVGNLTSVKAHSSKSAVLAASQ